MVEIVCPSEATAKINAILSARRGQILGFDTRESWPGWDCVRATMPEAEIGDLIVELRSATAGAGGFTRAVRPHGRSHRPDRRPDHRRASRRGGVKGWSPLGVSAPPPPPPPVSVGRGDPHRGIDSASACPISDRGRRLMVGRRRQ